MKYARAAWKQERASWRAVIQLNLIRSVITIVETLQAEMDGDPIAPLRFNPLNMGPGSLFRRSMDTDSDAFSLEVPPPSAQLTDKHRLLKLRLGPLRRVEADLMRQLGAGTEEVVGEGIGAGVIGEGLKRACSRSREFGVRELKDALYRSRQNTTRGEGQPDEATEIIASCREDIKALWTDDVVRRVLEKRKVRVEESAGL